MASRIVSMAAFGLVAVVVAVLAIVFVSGRSAQQPDAPPPVAFVAKVMEQPASLPAQAATEQASEPVAAAATASGSQEQGLASPEPPIAGDETTEAPPAATLPPWPELESRFAEVRNKRTTIAGSLRLQDSYTYLARPASTNSQGYPEHCARLAEWRREVPDSTTALICLAEAHIKWAWEARGSGWASTVTQEGWEQFSTRIAEARRLLEEAIESGVQDGEAYAKLMTVAMAEGVDDEQARAWFDAGQKLDPSYAPLYTAMAIRLMPRWGGEPGDIERFAADVVELVPGDDGLELFGHIALAIHQYECNMPDTLFWGQYDRKLLMKAADVLAERYPNWEAAVHFAAVCAVATQDHDAARRMRPRLGPFNADHRVWLWEPSYNSFLRWSEPLARPAGESNWMWGSHFRPCNIAFDADSRSIWCGQGVGPRVVALLDLETRSARAFLPSPLSHLFGFAVDPDKDWVLASMYGDAFQGWVLWDTSVPIPLLHPTENRCDAVAINPAREQLAWVEGSTLKLWDVKANQAGPTIDLSVPCFHIVFSPDGKLIATDVQQDSVWDTATGEKRFELPGGHDKPLREHGVTCQNPLSFDDDGSLWAVGSEILQDTPRPGRSTLPTKHPLLRYAPNAESWDIVIGDLDRERNGPPIMPVLSNDRRWLAMAQRGQIDGLHPIQLWDVSAKKMARRLSGTLSQVGAMAFSSDSKQFAAIGNNGGIIKVWNLDEATSSGEGPQAESSSASTGASQ